MFLHIGRDIAVDFNDIITIFDMDTATFSHHTRNYLANAEKNNRIVAVSDELPKSAIVCRENGKIVVYISQISSRTLLGRAEDGINAFTELL